MIVLFNAAEENNIVRELDLPASFYTILLSRSTSPES